MRARAAAEADETLVLGIDPGSLKTGYGIIAQRGRSLRVLESGTLKLDRKAGVAERLGQLQKELEAIVERYAMVTAAVEDVFIHKNVRSALALGQARGVVLGVCGRRGVRVAAYPPAMVKLAVAGHGRAGKVQIQRMIKVLLGMEREPASDEADALAVALCHALKAKGRPEER